MVPPLAVRVAEYATVCVPLASDAVVMVSGPAITMLKAFVAFCTGLLASVTRAVKL